MPSKTTLDNGSRFPKMTVASMLMMVGVTFHLPIPLFALLILPIRLVLFFNHTHLVATTCADGSLGRTKDVEDFNNFYSAEQSRLAQSAALAHPMQGMATSTSL
jgi:hypothetical protein